MGVAVWRYIIIYIDILIIITFPYILHLYILALFFVLVIYIIIIIMINSPVFSSI